MYSITKVKLDREKSREKWDPGGSPVVYVHCQTGKSRSVPLLKKRDIKKEACTWNDRPNYLQQRHHGTGEGECDSK